MFPVEGLEFEHFALLEGFQIGYLPGWVPEEAFAKCLRAWPHVGRLLKARHPPITPFIERVLAQHGPADDDADLARAEAELVRTCADVLLYNVRPEAYDDLEYARFDYLGLLKDRLRLDDAVVIDAAAGTGSVAFSLCPVARLVYAMEPVGRLREYIREKAIRRGVRNVFAVNGRLHAIPFPDGFADVLVASQALGWAPEAEIVELERVVRDGGTIALVNDAEKREMLGPAGYREEPVEGHEYLLLFTKVV